MSSELIERLEAWSDLDTEYGHNARGETIAIAATTLATQAATITQLQAELAESREVPGRIVDWLRDEGTLQIDTGYDAGIYGGQGMLFAAAQIEARDWSKP